MKNKLFLIFLILFGCSNLKERNIYQWEKKCEKIAAFLNYQHHEIDNDQNSYTCEIYKEEHTIEQTKIFYVEDLNILIRLIEIKENSY